MIIGYQDIRFSKLRRNVICLSFPENIPLTYKDLKSTVDGTWLKRLLFRFLDSFKE